MGGSRQSLFGTVRNGGLHRMLDEVLSVAAFALKRKCLSRRNSHRGLCSSQRVLDVVVGVSCRASRCIRRLPLAAPCSNGCSLRQRVFDIVVGIACLTLEWNVRSCSASAAVCSGPAEGMAHKICLVRRHVVLGDLSLPCDHDHILVLDRIHVALVSHLLLTHVPQCQLLSLVAKVLLSIRLKLLQGAWPHHSHTLAFISWVWGTHRLTGDPRGSTGATVRHGLSCSKRCWTGQCTQTNHFPPRATSSGSLP
mmetsp:Transcript_22723/g.53019  ORF Transcript_22723/g.53019 Transcript_22723/m.53019 type:complete len:252 (-) Transcript_22723:3-758(-)